MTQATVQLVEERRSQLFDAVTALGFGDRPWTVVDYPNHLNCGDAALYLGLERVAGALGAPVVRVLDRDSYRPELVHPETLPVLQAGGNWGGLYPTHHRLRLQLLEDTRGRDVLQLAQSIEYADDSFRDELRRAVSRHGMVTLLVRDQRSYDIAVRDYDCRVELVPDLAFALGAMERLSPSVPVRSQVRTDKEGSVARVEGDTFDWLTAPRGSRPWVIWQTMMAINRLQRRTATEAVRRATVSAASALARTSVLRGRELLSAGEVIVTDRLHGHVLCTLLSIPHVVVNDRFGKIEALRTTWTHADRGHVFVSSWDGVPAALDELTHRRIPAV